MSDTNKGEVWFFNGGQLYINGKLVGTVKSLTLSGVEEPPSFAQFREAELKHRLNENFGNTSPTLPEYRDSEDA